MGEMGTELTEYIDTHDAACPRCQYKLCGLQTALCPECGFEFTLEHLQSHQAALKLEQQEWLKRVRAIRIQSLTLAAVLLTDAAAMIFLMQGVSSGKRLQVSLFIALVASIELLVFMPLTSKKYRDSELTYFIIGLCEEGFGAVVLVASLPVIIAAVYLILWAIGYL